MKLLNVPLGLLFNFHEVKLVDVSGAASRGAIFAVKPGHRPRDFRRQLAPRITGSTEDGNS